MIRRLFLSFAAATAFLAGGQWAAWGQELALGDGKVSGEPRAGHVFSCRQRFDPEAPGAAKPGDWLGDTVWEPARKPYIQGSVKWPARISMTRTGNRRVIQANNLPTHPSGVFPVARDDPAFVHDRNAARIVAQNIRLELPAVPQPAAEASCLPMGMIGFALTNGAIFSALDSSGEDALAHEMQDRCSGHPHQSGQYHYHNMSPCAFDTRSQPGDHSDLIGYALDGFGVFGLFGEQGKKLTNADLDACHGHTHAINWDGRRLSLYHFHATDEYPYTIGCFRGTPVPVAIASGSGQDGQPALSDAAAELGVSASRLREAIGRTPPDFERASRMLGIPPAQIRRAMQNAGYGN
jgi:hypothetical protein